MVTNQLPRRTHSARYQKLMDDASKGINRCFECDKKMDTKPNPPGYYVCWDCIDREENDPTWFSEYLG